MTATQGRGPIQSVEARELRRGDYIVAREWTVLAIQEQEGGNSFKVSATSSGGLVRQTVFRAEDLVEVIRG